MENNKRKFVTLEESNNYFSSLGEEEKEIQELSDKVFALMQSFVQERIRKHLSQRDLAELLNWKQPALARMERLDVIPRLDTFLKAVMKIGGNVYIEYFNDKIPQQCICGSNHSTYDVSIPEINYYNPGRMVC